MSKQQYINDLIKNHKIISSLVATVITIFSVSYGVASYVISSHDSMIDAVNLRTEFNEYKKEAAITHKEFDKRLTDYEREFKMTTTKLDVSLAKIATDLQFIKEHLMSKGMDK